MVLVAESHVFTSADDLRLHVQQQRLPSLAQHTPQEFVRLVYCLGYGCNAALSAVPLTHNRGTPQFWQLFGELAGTSLESERLSTHLSDRLQWKARTLGRLVERGIWLLDASLHAIYAPGGRVIRGKQKNLLHQLWWANYGRYDLDIIRQENAVVQVWAVGKTVFHTLAARAKGWTCTDWIYQPNARRDGLAFPRDHGKAALMAAVRGGG